MMLLRTTFLPAAGAALALLSSSANAFVTPAASANARPTTLRALPEFLDGILGGGSDEPLTAAEYAQQRFWFYFFAGSGAGGIGIAQIPSIFNEASVARSVAGTGSTLGGAALDAGPLVGFYYDNEISSADVADAISKAPTAEFISSRSESLNYMASKGYIEKGDFIKEMGAKNCNPADAISKAPTAEFIFYDAISTGKGGVVSPIVYEDKLSSYREGVSGGDVASSFVGDLNSFLAVKVAAFFGLVFCLLVDFGFIANAGIEGWLS
eukprot:CAMPEP_0183745408 /NCGR_PEP_ID=MMETSP0737-20130205/66225_1 /TAXON_ID=385413 /ORGANISM="Thalassiosira miniscula, Strain CCMP1093" /LENGTH=266 /DNA_ID=CAMNT_0025981075 /DNA_START=130 /DNA_END=930 /DNA_ORIENTATION=+